jgi:hypothetical protein
MEIVFIWVSPDLNKNATCEEVAGGKVEKQ